MISMISQLVAALSWSGVKNREESQDLISLALFVTSGIIDIFRSMLLSPGCL